MARKKKEELVEEVTMIADDTENFIEEAIEDVQEVIEDIQEKIEEVVEDVQEAVEDAVEDIKEFFTGKSGKADNKEHYEGSIIAKKDGVNAISQADLNVAFAEAEKKVGGSINERKDKTFNDTAVGGLVGTTNEDHRSGNVFFRV